MGSLLGAAMGPAEAATIHRSVSSGGLYFRTKITLDLQLPLPDEISAAHEDPSRGCFKAKVKFESLPQFCYLCGVIGHVNRNCLRKDDLDGQPPRYGKHMVAQEFGPRVNENTLARRRRRFVWKLAENCPGNQMAAVSTGRRPRSGEANDGRRQSSTLHLGMTSHLGKLCISAPQGSLPSIPVVSTLLHDERVTEHQEPAAKRARLGTNGDEAGPDMNLEVVAAGLNRSQADP
ncbi:unnamed protein product [Linum trigynum]|uniref:CCHC-type domain-containing protein n=1 Tax=Linum trigynum TaxID=586398 RepID=A0AAV2DXN9_9ROSI